MTPRRNATFAVVLAGVVFAHDKGFSPPPLNPARTYAAHETHAEENVTVAIDPFDTDAKAAIFKIKYKNYELLPVRLIITNDGDEPLMLDNMKIEFVTARRDKLRPADRADLLRKLARPDKITRPTARFPIPIPHDNKPVSREAREEMDTVMFINVPVSPHSTNGGFLFFDVSGIQNPEAEAHLYVSGIKAGAKELFYFDIPLDDSRNPPAANKATAN